MDGEHMRPEGRGRGIVGYIVIAALFFAIGYVIADNAPTSALPVYTGSGSGVPAGVDVAPLWKAWNVLNSQFVPATTTKTVSQQEMLWGAIEGLASSLGDPYTVFLPPQENKIFQENISGAFGGAGMEIGQRNGAITVIAPLKGSPAERAGIKSGDIILAIGASTTESMSVDKAVSLIRGEVGTKVKLTLARDGKSAPFDVTLTRDVIQVPTIDTELRPDGIFVIKFYQFSANSPQLFRDALRQFIAANTDKLIIDLRGNPGGYLEAAVDTASFFLPPGKVVVRENYGPGKDELLHRTRGYQVFNDNLKIVLLVDQGSASASEIFAGAMQEYHRATLVGTRTFGKGSVQELVDITPEASLKVTIARWLTPSGRSISAVGVSPDVEVKMTDADIQAGKDAQLLKAVEILKSYGSKPIDNAVNPLDPAATTN